MTKLTAHEFLNHVVRTCEERGINLNVQDSPYVLYSTGITGVSGYFDNDAKELAIAIGKPQNEWFEILVHESCHMDQWHEKADIYTLHHSPEIVSIDSWMSGVEYPEEQYTQAIHVAQQMERDCEERSIEKIVNFGSVGLDIDLETYIQKANAYLYFYTVLLHTRKWSDTPPYIIPEILSMMPSTLETDFSTLPKSVLDMYMAMCYK